MSKMAAERGFLPPNEAENPWKNGLCYLCSLSGIWQFASPFIVVIPFIVSDQVKFIGACILAAALALAILGLAKAEMAGQSYAPSVAITLGNGTIAAAAYALGWALRSVLI